MHNLFFVIGGCKSGKSQMALDLVGRLGSYHTDTISEQRKIFVATCVPYDHEMQDRVAKHKQQRDTTWQTVEESINIDAVLSTYNQKNNVIVLDCITLWINNLLMQDNDATYVVKKIDLLVESMQQIDCPLIIVSNEVGTGIVPENALARKFRDLAGIANQKIAANVNNVIWMVAGIPVCIKGALV